MRVEVAHAGEGQYLALVLDQDGATLEALWGTRLRVLVELERRWPDLPVRRVPFIREPEDGNPAVRLGRWWRRTLRDGR